MGKKADAKLETFIKDRIIELQKEQIQSFKEIGANLLRQIANLEEIIENKDKIISYIESSTKFPAVASEPSIKTVVRRAKRSLQHVVSCAYCAKVGNEQLGPDGRNWHIDHIEPKSLGGSNHPTNLVKSCATCNIKKGTRRLMPVRGTITAGNSKVKVDG